MIPALELLISCEVSKELRSVPSKELHDTCGYWKTNAKLGTAALVTHVD